MDVIQEPRSIRKNLAGLAVPIFIETLLIMMLGAVDTVMLSQYSDTVSYTHLDVYKRQALGVIGVNWIGNPADSTRLSFNDAIRIMAVSRADVYKRQRAWVLRSVPERRRIRTTC